jgi:hypothetical protein
LEFDGVTFKIIDKLSQNFLEENASKDQNYQNIYLVFNSNKVWINTAETDRLHFKNELAALLQLSSEGKSLIHLNFNANLLYQDYLFYRTIIENLSHENILINPIEFIYNENED